MIRIKFLVPRLTSSITEESAVVIVIDESDLIQNLTSPEMLQSGRLWVTEWNAGNLAMYNPATIKWKEWRLHGSNPMPYAVYVDKNGTVLLSDFGANAIVRFDPIKEKFNVVTLPTPGANVRQILGRSGEIWGAESGVNKLVVIRTH